MINFEITEEQMQMQAMAKKFAENEIRPVAPEIDKNPEHPFPRELMNKMAQNGFFDMFIPEEYGGIGADYLYPHNFEGGFVAQEYLPGGKKGQYYRPKEAGYEKNINSYLQKLQTLIKDNKSDKGLKK